MKSILKKCVTVFFFVCYIAFGVLGIFRTLYNHFDFIEKLFDSLGESSKMINSIIDDFLSLIPTEGGAIPTISIAFLGIIACLYMAIAYREKREYSAELLCFIPLCSAAFLSVGYYVFGIFLIFSLVYSVLRYLSFSRALIEETKPCDFKFAKKVKTFFNDNMTTITKVSSVCYCALCIASLAYCFCVSLPGLNARVIDFMETSEAFEFVTSFVVRSKYGFIYDIVFVIGFISCCILINICDNKKKSRVLTFSLMVQNYIVYLYSTGFYSTELYANNEYRNLIWIISLCVVATLVYVILFLQHRTIYTNDFSG